MEWLDEPSPERVQDSLKQVWKELRDAKRTEARATEALHGTININDEATMARVARQEEVNRTKHVAQCICATITGRPPSLQWTIASSCTSSTAFWELLSSWWLQSSSSPSDALVQEVLAGSIGHGSMSTIS